MLGILKAIWLFEWKHHMSMNLKISKKDKVCSTSWFFCNNLIYRIQGAVKIQSHIMVIKYKAF